MDFKQCNHCKETKPISDFYADTNKIDGYRNECKDCIQGMNKKARNNRTLRNTPQRLMEINNSGITKQCESCLETKVITEFNIRRDAKDGHDCYCRKCNIKMKHKEYHSHKNLSDNNYKQWRDEQNALRKEEKIRLKTEVFSHYCIGETKCLNPFNLHKEDITDLDILTLDHINGDGYKDRDDNGHRIGGITFYRKLKGDNYPPGLQILCGNCQMKKKILNNEHGNKRK